MLELLIVIGIIALLLAILLPSLGAGRSAAQDLACRANMKAVLMAFHNFADESGAGSRGESDFLGPGKFRVEDFQESIYGIDEFWSGAPVQREPIDPRMQPLMCPAGSSRLERRSGIPCSSGAITPAENVSTGFNARLNCGAAADGTPQDLFICSRILTVPDVPLLLDVDGEEAVRRGVMPYYAAPPLPMTDVPDIYADGVMWFPSMRHRNRTNIGFVGGHVLSSGDAATEPWARWSYQGRP